ncbi:hypothetical protein EMIT079MI2_40214 [Bacillus sp. IT-79MI2]
MYFLRKYPISRVANIYYRYKTWSLILSSSVFVEKHLITYELAYQLTYELVCFFR